MSEHVIESSQRANTTPAAAKGPVLSRRRETDLPEKAAFRQRHFDKQTGACEYPCYGFDFSGVPAISGMARQNMPVLRSQPLVQRFPLDEGEASSAPCPNCPEAAANQDSEVSASEPEVSESVPEAGPTAEASSSAEETAAPEATSAAALIADEPAGALAPGQMRRGEFLARLRAEVTQAAESALAGTGRTTEDCPYLEYWFGYYQDQDSEHIERAIHRYAPETTAVRNAADYFPVIARRVGVSVERWARTGEIIGLPEGLSGMGMGLLGGLGGLVSGIGRMFFKARAGGARQPDDPRAVQAELGEGRSLDSGVRSRMESAFGMDFSHVRAHTDNAAAGLSTRMNARAFTVGEHVAFGTGEYQPGTMIGDALIAHELAHVVQQGGSDASIATMTEDGSNYNQLEADADRSAIGVVASLFGGNRNLVDNKQNVKPGLTSGLRLHRCNAGPRVTETPCNQAVKNVSVDLIRMHGASCDPATDISNVNKAYKTCCVNFAVGQSPPPISKDQSKKFMGGNTDLNATGITCSAITAEEKSMYDGVTAMHKLSSRMRVFYVRSYSGYTGLGFSRPPYCGAGYSNHVVLKNGASYNTTLGHEFGHILLNSGDHSNDSNNLMYKYNGPNMLIDPTQAKTIYKNA